MKEALIDKQTFQFLKSLAKNNNRPWFDNHKDAYLESQENMIAFVDRVILHMNKHDELEIKSGKKSLLRIYRDIRFSKDKTPYAPRFAFHFQRATKLKRVGYYANIKPGNSFIACGFFDPNKEDLKRIRLDIDSNYKEWNKLLKLKSIADNWGGLYGEQVATKPKGFPIDHPAIGLLRFKQFLFHHDFTDQEVLSPDFAMDVNRIFKTARPFLNYMSELLTTNLNGELIV